MRLTDDWFTVLSSIDGSDSLTYVNGRLNLEDFIRSQKLPIRIEIILRYDSLPDGMPTPDAGELIAEVDKRLRPAMEHDKLAILTCNYLGAGVKGWVFYSRTERIFGERLNDALEDLPTLPFSIDCIRDEDWSEYRDLLTLHSETKEG